jgi:hypothetical protein
LNLIQRKEIHDFDGGNIVIWVAYHVLTMFGFEFIYICHNGSDVAELPEE